MKTLFGFPIRDNETSGEKVPGSQKGIALIITVLAVAMIMVFSANMIINSQVNLETAIKARDNVKAEYMAKSGFNMALFLLSVDYGIDLAQYQQQKIDPSDGPGDMWGMMNGLPIGGETLEMLTATQEAFDLSTVNDDDAIDLLKLFDGQFVLNVEDEASKINLNECADSNCIDMTKMLEALLSCPAEKAYLEQKNLTPKQLVYRIKDWIDKDPRAEADSGLTDENEVYRRKEPPYNAKNVPMDTLEELKLIEGWDDDLYKIFSPYLTVYPVEKSPKINRNSISQQLFGCLEPDVKANCPEKMAKAFQALQLEGTPLDPGSLTCDKSPGDPNTGSGIKYATSSSVFRVTSTGMVGSQEKKLVTVVQRKVPDKAQKKERSYEILYWRLL